MKELIQNLSAKKAAVATALVGASLAASEAFATPLAAVDVADLATGISNQLVPIGSIGLAVLGVFLAVKTYKWIRRAF